MAYSQKSNQCDEPALTDRKDLKSRGFESVVRYIAQPTVLKALFSYRRAA